MNVPKIKKVAIIQTKQNFKWLSMQEIIPNLTSCWEKACLELSFESKVINVDDLNFKDLTKYILLSDVIVFTAFNESIAKLMRAIRVNLGIDAKFIFHLHGLTTIGLWPLEKFGVLNLFKSSDEFIGTCQGDLNCMRHVSPNAKITLIPYPYFPLNSSRENEADQIVFAYVGRLSDQKNITIIIEAYHLLLTQFKNLKTPPLLIYGKEDYLGSPNMGLESEPVLSKCENLIESLGLEKKVIFKGFVPREDLYKEIGPHHIFVSASTHSDENFGMALMHSLAQGGAAVVSAWGGHKVFKKYFNDDTLLLCPVHFKDSIPTVDPQYFAELMMRSFEGFQCKNNSQLPSYFSSESVSEQFRLLLTNEDHKSIKLLELTNLAHELFEQQKFYESQGFTQRVFRSYEDPLAQIFLKAYS